ncbi:MAG: hypothetical protein F6K22_06400 [Okeania sp. SIO2F4]|uniref:hypothetical protein n=1 Tax=Okeania sp. SIO2F4 TaxID=2607790 RepID=UPI00142C1B93|nr:hypothetical protein [Okeania sp. SIO2F4]NES02502.1 hypothetical protein [Okeania sp. SIO2F4]
MSDETLRFLQRKIVRSALLWRVTLWEKSSQIVRGLFDEILRFSQRNISISVRTLRVALF